MTGPKCPHWCTGNHDFGVHASAGRPGDGIFVRLLQPFSQQQPRIYISTGDIPASEAKNWAHTFAVLGKHQLAATVRMLGEWAEAGAEFIPVAEPVTAGVRSLVMHEECTIGARPGVVVNPSSHEIVKVSAS